VIDAAAHAAARRAGERAAAAGLDQPEVRHAAFIEHDQLAHQVAMIEDRTVLWSRWLFQPVTSSDLALLLVATMIVLAIGMTFAARRRAALALFVVGTTGYSLFFGFFHPGSMHHHGYLFLVWVLTAWLAWAGPASERPRVRR
jgi:hypothetical protein